MMGPFTVTLFHKEMKTVTKELKCTRCLRAGHLATDFMETTDREPSSDVTSLTSSDTSERHVADQRLQRGRELLERGRQGKKNEKQTTLAGFLPRRHRSETPSKRLRSDSQSPPMPHEKTARTFAAEK
nr:hypothetical protein BaRGS_026826 [Batillaria attramentaria]